MTQNNEQTKNKTEYREEVDEKQKPKLGFYK